MPTVGEIIDWVGRKYPNHGETEANLIKDLNDIHKEIYVKIPRIKNKRDIWSFKTVLLETPEGLEPLPTYDLANDCVIDMITSVQVSRTPTPNSPSDYDDYSYAGLNDDISCGNYYIDGGINPDTGFNMIGLIRGGDIIKVADLEVRVYYNVTANTLTQVSNIPNLELNYHPLLKYALVNSVASQGNNPDTEIADFYQRKFDEFFSNIQKDISHRFAQTPDQSNYVTQCWE